MDCIPAAKKRYLVLENGKVFEGYAFGANVQAIGEVVFSTNMSAFTQSVTDPNYNGQLVVQTFPLVGNCGVNPADIESNSCVKGYIVKEWCQSPSHFSCTGTLDTFFVEHGIPGLWGVDTRAVTKLIRSGGVMRGALVDDPADISKDTLVAYSVGDAVSRVTCAEQIQFQADNAQHHVVLWDLGKKASTVRSLTARGCSVTAVPAGCTADQILALNPDGIMLSNGPGNPAQYGGIVEEIKKILPAGVAIFGSGLGHQLLALACGGAVEALPYGHRGGCSVRDLETGRTLITSQNHGYAVKNKLPQGAKLRFVNANDGSCEGLDYTSFNGFSVQFKPEACWSPNNTDDIMDRFVASLKRRDA